MKKINVILEELKLTSSKNEKIRILEENKDNDELRLVMETTYSKTLNFFVRKFSVPESSYVGKNTLTESIALLIKNIANRVYTGHDAKSYLEQLVMTCEDPVTLVKVINRDLDCGVQVGSINKVWKDLIKKPPYLSYKLFEPSMIKKIKLPAYSQVKLDGLFADIKVIGDSVILSSRDGKVLDIPLTEALKSELLSIRDKFEENIVIHGEALVKWEGEDAIQGFAPRAIGNGYLNQDVEKIDPELVHLSIWDVLTQDEYEARKSNIHYKTRLKKLEETFKGTSGQLNIADYVVCNTYSEIINHYSYLRGLGLEGSVVKEENLLWKDGKLSSGGWKLKNEFVCDYEIIATYPHKKNPNLIGGLTVKSIDGKLISDVGSGLTDELRSKSPEYFIGKIAAVKANDLSYVAGRETVSLFLPRVVEIRVDKTEADNFDKIKKELNSFVELMKITIGKI